MISISLANMIYMLDISLLFGKYGSKGLGFY
jgi:hypothetical protein